jgi:hypothetical protein
VNADEPETKTERAARVALNAGRYKHERDQALTALADCVVKATPFGKQDGEFIAYYYISPTGPIHRAIPLLAEHGIVVRPGFDGREKAGIDTEEGR